MTACTVYRCSRQPELYLYVREGLSAGDLPEPLRQRAGRLTRVMDLQLTPERKLARADVVRVIAALEATGWFLQLPPDGATHAHLKDGD